jgi:hypothetical protein
MNPREGALRVNYRRNAGGWRMAKRSVERKVGKKAPLFVNKKPQKTS